MCIVGPIVTSELVIEEPKQPPRKPSTSKVQKFFGEDTPVRYLAINSETKPWYLKADHPPQDLLTNPDGHVRGGTLPALIERLTDHEFRGKHS